VGRCKAARRRRCWSTSSRSANAADAPAAGPQADPDPPELEGRMGVANDFFVARRQRCASTSPPPRALNSPRKPHARDASQFSDRLLGWLELIQTICEHLEWTTPAGRNKVDSCAKALTKLQTQGLLKLPPKRVVVKEKETRQAAVEEKLKIYRSALPTLLKRFNKIQRSPQS
jgi:hypothetical protein